MAKNDYAIVIGISRYPKLKNLEGPLQDAEDFCKWLAETGEVAHIAKVLSDTPPEPVDRPIQHEIDQAFDMVFELARKNDLARRLYVYFAGHGCSLDSNHIALLMANASKENLGNAIDAPHYHAGLASKALFQEQLIFYDCCRNYDRRVRGRPSPWTDDPKAGAADVKQFILYGAAFTQYANERVIEYSERRGLFTKALLEGLRGYAAQQRRGKWTVTTNSLVSYVTPRLNRLAQKFNLRQTPSLAANLLEPLEIVEVAPKLFDVTVTGPPEGAEVIVKNSEWNEIMRDKVREGKVKFRLTPGPYSFVMLADELRTSTKDVEPEQPSVINL